MYRLVTLFFSILISIQSFNAEKTIVVETKLGKIEGILEENGDGFQVQTFLGIKYGDIPHRFAKATPVKQWSGVKSAKRMPSRCHQLMILGFLDDSPSITNDTEDCLSLNLVAPSKKVNMNLNLNRESNCERMSLYQDPNGYPVMVFIHGGGWTEGSSLEFGIQGIKQWFVPKGVVFVIFQYRLGPWGFFSTGTNEAAGNWGLWDQVLLLQWVRDNIKAFGGDPNKVTIFGQSAGAMSAAFHTVSPKSRDLFHNAILMSGSLMSHYAVFNGTIEESYQLAKMVGCSQTKVSEMLGCIRKVPIEQFKTASKEKYASGEIAFMPVIDKDFLPDNLETMLRSTPPNKPIIIGVTKQEMGIVVTPPNKKLESPFLVQDPTKFTVEELREKINPYLTFKQSYTNVDLVTELCLYHYLDTNGFRDNSTLITQAYIDFMSDDIINAAAYKEATMRREIGSKMWLYSFDYFNKGLFAGSYHWFDLWYLFKFPLFRNSVEYSKDEEKVAQYYTTLFTNFAKFDNPTPTEIDGIKWLPVTNDNRETYLKIDRKLEIGNLWNRKGGTFWNDLLPKIQHALVAKSGNDSKDEL